MLISRVELFYISYSITSYFCRNETSRKNVEEEKARMIATQPQYKSGMLLRVSNLPKNAGFREMREFFARVCDVAWIDMADDQVVFASWPSISVLNNSYSLHNSTIILYDHILYVHSQNWSSALFVLRV